MYFAGCPFSNGKRPLAEERAQDSLNGGRLFSSLSSAECTEIEYVTEWYSESPSPVDKGELSRKQHRNFAQRMQVELSSRDNSSCNEAPTASRSVYIRGIHHHIDHNDGLQRRLAYSTQLISTAEHIATGDK